MNINLNTLNKPYIIDQEINVPSSYYEKTDVKDLKNIYVKGKVFYNIADEVEVDLNVKGIIVINDAITLEKIEIPFDLDIKEVMNDFAKNYKIKQNMLDIIELLWENIILEVPISLTKSPNLELKGDGWVLKN